MGADRGRAPRQAPDPRAGRLRPAEPARPRLLDPGRAGRPHRRAGPRRVRRPHRLPPRLRPVRHPGGGGGGREAQAARGAPVPRDDLRPAERARLDHRRVPPVQAWRTRGRRPGRPGDQGRHAPCPGRARSAARRRAAEARAAQGRVLRQPARAGPRPRRPPVARRSRRLPRRAQRGGLGRVPLAGSPTGSGWGSTRARSPLREGSAGRPALGPASGSGTRMPRTDTRRSSSGFATPPPSGSATPSGSSTVRSAPGRRTTTTRKGDLRHGYVEAASLGLRRGGRADRGAGAGARRAAGWVWAGLGEAPLAEASGAPRGAGPPHPPPGSTGLGRRHRRRLRRWGLARRRRRHAGARGGDLQGGPGRGLRRRPGGLRGLAGRGGAPVPGGGRGRRGRLRRRDPHRLARRHLPRLHRRPAVRCRPAGGGRPPRERIRRHRRAPPHRPSDHHLDREVGGVARGRAARPGQRARPRGKGGRPRPHDRRPPGSPRRRGLPGAPGRRHRRTGGPGLDGARRHRRAGPQAAGEAARAARRRGPVALRADHRRCSTPAGARWSSSPTTAGSTSRASCRRWSCRTT